MYSRLKYLFNLAVYPLLFHLTLKVTEEPDMILGDTLRKLYLLPKLGYHYLPTHIVIENIHTP